MDFYGYTSSLPRLSVQSQRLSLSQKSTLITSQQPFNKVYTSLKASSSSSSSFKVTATIKIQMLKVESGNNIRSVSTLNLISNRGAYSTLRNIHGILNAVIWGIMMPIEAYIARYLDASKSVGSVWFYIHVFFQSSAYIMGVAGWAIGFKLGHESPAIQYTTHRAIGIDLFSLATAQVFAIFLRPKPEHKYRIYWNIYHEWIACTLIILAEINVFKGLDILKPEKQWIIAFTAIIAALALLAALLELYCCIVFIIYREDESAQTAQGGIRTNPYLWYLYYA